MAKEHRATLEFPELLVVARVAPGGEIRLAFADHKADRVFEWVVTPAVWARWASLSQLIEHLNGEVRDDVPKEKPVLFAIGDPFPRTPGYSRPNDEEP